MIEVYVYERIINSTNSYSYGSSVANSFGRKEKISARKGNMTFLTIIIRILTILAT